MTCLGVTHDTQTFVVAATLGITHDPQSYPQANSLGTTHDTQTQPVRLACSKSGGHIAKVWGSSQKVWGSSGASLGVMGDPPPCITNHYQPQTNHLSLRRQGNVTSRAS